MYDLAIPTVQGEATPFYAAPKRSTTPDEPASCLGGTSTPKTSLPPSPAGAMDDSDTELNGTIDRDQPQSQGSPSRSDRVLRKQTHHASGGSKDSAPP